MRAASEVDVGATEPPVKHQQPNGGEYAGLNCGIIARLAAVEGELDQLRGLKLEVETLKRTVARQARTIDRLTNDGCAAQEPRGMEGYRP